MGILMNKQLRLKFSYGVMQQAEAYGDRIGREIQLFVPISNPECDPKRRGIDPLYQPLHLWQLQETCVTCVIGLAVSIAIVVLEYLWKQKRSIINSHSFEITADK